jgi:hypothetical protein
MPFAMKTMKYIGFLFSDQNQFHRIVKTDLWYILLVFYSLFLCCQRKNYVILLVETKLHSIKC